MVGYACDEYARWRGVGNVSVLYSLLDEWLYVASDGMQLTSLETPADGPKMHVPPLAGVDSECIQIRPVKDEQPHAVPRTAEPIDNQPLLAMCSSKL